jgi:lipoic acid synthetase
MGDICTRNCRFCNIQSGIPSPPERDEPQKIAQAVLELNLQYAVITSVTRDDLPDGGAGHFAGVIHELRKLVPDVKIEVLTPDFEGKTELIDIVIKAKPDVFNHNIETVENLYKKARPMAIYERSLEFLRYVKENNPQITTKSGIMVGLGETFEEIEKTFFDLKSVNCDIVTAGQYMQPSKRHLGVEKYYDESDFEKIRKIAKSVGISQIIASGLVRSSYNAYEAFEKFV